MRRFMAASSAGAARNIGNSFVVEKTVRDVGEEEGVCVWMWKSPIREKQLGKI